MALRLSTNVCPPHSKTVLQDHLDEEREMKGGQRERWMDESEGGGDFSHSIVLPAVTPLGAITASMTLCLSLVAVWLSQSTTATWILHFYSKLNLLLSMSKICTFPKTVLFVPLNSSKIHPAQTSLTVAVN